MTKTLFLLRHAKSGWDDPVARDFDRPLNKKGEKAAHIMGEWMASNGITFEHVIASPAVRVIDTEHGPFDVEMARDLIRAGKFAGSTPFVRVKDSSRASILKMLDAGAMGIIIPNVFTPNNDGNNDDFVVEGTAFTTFQFTVFNRWGQEVYASRNGRVTWNGRDNGNSPLPDGVYFYELVESRSGKSMVHTGYIQLARGQ